MMLSALTPGMENLKSAKEHIKTDCSNIIVHAKDIRLKNRKTENNLSEQIRRSSQ